MRCAGCGWPNEESTVLSTHHTSQGWARYRRCVCGIVRIELVTLTADGIRARAVRELGPTTPRNLRRQSPT